MSNEKLSIITIGDPHFQITNIPDVELFITAITLLIDKIKPDVIIVLGDLLHTHERLHTLAMNKALDFIKTLRSFTKTYVIVGNHDYIQNQQFLTENHWLCGMKEWENTVIVDRVITDYIKGEKLVFVPYVPPGRFVEALNTSKDEWKDASCIFAHQEFEGCKMGAIISVEGDKWPSEYPQVVSGHIHSRQFVKNNIYYPGSAMQHAFGESEKNVIAHLIFEKGTYTNHEYDLKLPRKKIVYIDAEDTDSYVKPTTDDKIKLTVSGCYDQFKAFKKTKKYKTLIEDGIKITFKPKKIDSLQNDDNKQKKDDVQFKTVLHDLITSMADNELLKAYELVVV